MIEKNEGEELLLPDYSMEVPSETQSISLLEALLRYTVSDYEAKREAAILLKACGSVAAVFEAPYSILTEYGLSMNQAVLIKLVPALTRRYFDDKFFSNNSRSPIINFNSKLIAAFISCSSERVLLVLRDKYDTELFFGVINKGSVNASEIFIKRIIELALRYNAYSAVIAHNHPSGVAYPSDKDAVATVKVKNALRNVGVTLTNHYVVASNNVFSMADSEEFFDLFL